jgi:hypothetical protein
MAVLVLYRQAMILLADFGVNVPYLAVDGLAQMYGGGMSVPYRAVVAVVNELVTHYHNRGIPRENKRKIKIVFFVTVRPWAS